MTTKVAELQVEGYKRITGALAKFDTSKPGVVEIGGANEQGKSSFLDALEVAIAGPRKGPSASKPVNTGKQRARIIATFEEEDGTKLVVTRTFAPDGTTTIVVHQDGLKVGRPAEMLARLWNHVAFDPFAWASSDSKTQVDTLVRVTGVDPKPFDDAYKQAYARRTDVNRERERLAGVLTNMPASDDETLADREFVSIVDLTEQRDAIAARNAQRLYGVQHELTLTQQIAQFEEQIAALQIQLEAAIVAREEVQEQLRASGPEESVEDLTQQIRSADATNQAIREQKNRAVVQKDHDELLTRSANLSQLLEETLTDKRKAFADADMPVPGLTIEEEEVYLNGTPFSQTSPGGKLRTSVAIAMALNPDLRAIIIRDGALLDKANRAIVNELAEANDFLVLMEVVDEAGPSGIVFEDGQIRGAVEV